MPAPFKSEREMLRAVRWQLVTGWELFQEVKLRGSVADLVAVERGGAGRVWVLEGKLSRGFAVFEQASAWTPHAHLVSVVTPVQSRGPRLAPVTLARAMGLGILEVGRDGTVRELVPPPLRRRPPAVDKLRAVLADAHSSGDYAEAGAQQGTRFTPWVRTCRNLSDYVSQHPGEFLADAMRAVRHHYGSSSAAMSALTGWLRAGRVRGVELRKEGGRLRLYPAPDRPTWREPGAALRPLPEPEPLPSPTSEECGQPLGCGNSLCGYCYGGPLVHQEVQAHA